MQAYKIVYINQKGDKFSLLTTDPEMMVEYLPQEWVAPRAGYGPLLCFDSLENAKKFFGEVFDDRFKRWEIWECEIVKSEDKEVWNKERYELLRTLPRGTILADKVKLTRRVLLAGL